MTTGLDTVDQAAPDNANDTDGGQTGWQRATPNRGGWQRATPNGGNRGGPKLGDARDTAPKYDWAAKARTNKGTFLRDVVTARAEDITAALPEQNLTADPGGYMALVVLVRANKLDASTVGLLWDDGGTVYDQFSTLGGFEQSQGLEVAARMSLNGRKRFLERLVGDIAGGMVFDDQFFRTGRGSRLMRDAANVLVQEGFGKDDPKQHSAIVRISSGAQVVMADNASDQAKNNLDDGEEVADWTPDMLDRMNDVLRDLPTAHVAQNGSLGEFMRYKETSGKSKFIGGAANMLGAGGAGGVYYNQGGHLGIVANKKSLNETRSNPLGATKLTEDSDITNRLQSIFNQTLRHEVGHGVEKAIDAPGSICKTPHAGAWEEYDSISGGSVNTLSFDLITDAKATDNAAQEVIAQHSEQLVRRYIKFALLADSFKNVSDSKKVLKEAYQSINGMDKPDKFDKLAKKLFGGPTAKAIKDGKGENSWSKTSPVAVNGHRYQESYAGDWVRYNIEARSRKVSNYQFRAPGEWFAEVYAAYYEPGPEGNLTNGALLRRADPAMAQYIESNLDSATHLAALTQEGVDADIQQIILEQDQARQQGAPVGDAGGDLGDRGAVAANNPNPN